MFSWNGPQLVHHGTVVRKAAITWNYDQIQSTVVHVYCPGTTSHLERSTIARDCRNDLKQNWNHLLLKILTNN